MARRRMPRMMFDFVDGAAGNELSERLKERVMQVGFVFLLAFMSVVIYLDILKL